MKTNSGMSLVGVLLAVAILSMVSYGLMTLFNQSIANQRHIEFRQAKENVRLHTIGILSDRIACTATFGTTGGATGVNPTVGANQFNQIRTAPGQVQYQVGQNYEGGKLRVLSMSFPTNLPTTPPHTYRQFNAGVPKGSAEFLMLVQDPGGGSGGGPRELSVIVKLVVDLNASNQIQTCVAVGNDADDIWKLNSVSEVYYNGGNVGIGNADPNYPLDVTGDVNVSGTLSVGLRINSPNILAGTNGVANGMVTAGTIQASKFLYTSDARLKTKISPAPGLKLLNQLQGVEFTWKRDGSRAFGFIAQDIEKAMPTAVSTDAESGIKRVDYFQILAPLVESAKEIARENHALELRLRELEKKLESR